MEKFSSTHYERLQSDDDEEENVDEDLPPQVHITAPGEEGNGRNGRWNHIENLDDFFIRVYDYHRQNGFVCILLKECFELAQYIFIVLFTTFLIFCVDYDKLFTDKEPVLIECINFYNVRHANGVMVVFLLIASLFWVVRVAKVILYCFKLLEIRSFYRDALHITEDKLTNMQWKDVQQKLINVQKEHQMCVHKAELTELDIYHRILRWKNYLIAMQNKGVISCVYSFPLIGKRAFLTEGMKYNLKLILFWGPDAPFQDSWKLKPEYKSSTNRQALADRLSMRILWLGVLNFVLLPFIFAWQVLYSFFSYTEMVKRSPGTFGARHWSYYGRLFLRHFNELDHEFKIRLNKAYEPAVQYTNIFTSPFLAIISKNIAFVAGSFFAVLTCLSVYDQDVFRAEHMLTTIASLGLIIKICYAFIPDENLIWCPEQLLKQVLVHIHYIPDEWKTKAHTSEVFQEFQQLFEYKAVFVLQELVSALVTPFLLCFSIRYKALDIVDFFRNFTVEVVGVGDVCSFAQMDVRKHGHPEWMSHGLTAANQYEQAENGKTELSLLQFSIKNPQWKPPQSQAQFMSTIKENAGKDSFSSLQTSVAVAQHEIMGQSRLQSLGLPSLAPVAPVTQMSQSLMSTSHSTIDHTGVEERLKMEQEMNSSMLYMHELHDRAESAEYSHEAPAFDAQVPGSSCEVQETTSPQIPPSSSQDSKV